MGRVLLMLCIFILSIAAGPSSVTAEASNIQTIHVTVLHADGTPASGTLVELLLHDPGQVIAVAKTDLNGRVDFSVDLSRLTVSSLNKPISDIHFAIRSWGYPDEFAIRHFTKTIVLDRLRFNSAEANEIEGGSEFHLQIRLDKVKPFSSRVRTSISNVTPMSCVIWNETNYPSQWTRVGEVHTTNGVRATFSYGVGSALDIDVKVSINGGPWQVSGSRTMTNSTSTAVTWPTLTGTSGYGREVESQFDYRRRYWVCPDATEFTEVYAVRFVGGTDWGASLYGLDDRPWQEIEAGRWGHWARYLAQSSYRRTVAEGKRHNAVVVLNVSGYYLTLGATMNYNSYTTIAYSFGSTYSHYYLYDNCASCSQAFQTIYVSHR